MALVPTVPDALYLGSQSLDRVYQGVEQIWPGPQAEPMRFVGGYVDAANLTNYTYSVDLGAAGGTVVVLATQRSSNGNSGIQWVEIDGTRLTQDAFVQNGSAGAAHSGPNPGGQVTIETLGVASAVRQGIGVWVLSGTRTFATGAWGYGNAGSYTHTTQNVPAGGLLVFQGSSQQATTMLSSGATERAFIVDGDGYGHVSADNDNPNSPDHVIAGSTGSWRVTQSAVYL